MYFIFPIMNTARGIVGQEYLDRREVGQQRLSLALLVKEVPARFVFPGSLKSSQRMSAVLPYLMMQINDIRL